MCLERRVPFLRFLFTHFAREMDEKMGQRDVLTLISRIIKKIFGRGVSWFYLESFSDM